MLMYMITSMSRITQRLPLPKVKHAFSVGLERVHIRLIKLDMAQPCQSILDLYEAKSIRERNEKGVTQVNEEFNVIIQRSITDVFAYVSDLGNLVEWSGMVIAVKHTYAALPKPGSQVRCTFQFLGQWIEQTFEVIEWQTPRQITLKSASGNIPCVFSFRFEAVEEGTLVCLDAMLHPALTGGMIGLSEAVVAHMMHRQVANDLLTLKELLEGMPCQGFTPLPSLAHLEEEWGAEPAFSVSFQMRRFSCGRTPW